MVTGSYPVEKLAERLKISLPEGDYDTAAGLVLHLLGHIPEPGETVGLDGWKLVTTHIVSQRITRIVARKKDEPQRKPRA